MPNTTNFNWVTPADTDLVKDGAAAIRTLGNGIDTSFVDLKGGTTGQVLAKASNTDLDFTWATDASGIPATIFDAKGDLIAASAADTAARLAVGANNTVLTADSSTATGLKWATPAAGGMTELATGSLSGGSVTLTSIAGTYKHLQLIIQNYRPATDAAFLAVRINGDSTANRHFFADSVGGGPAAFNQTLIYASPAQDNGTSQALSRIDFPDYTNTSTWKMVFADCISNDDTTTAEVRYKRYFGIYNQTGAITSLTILPSSGNFNAGTYILYGVS